MLRKIDTMPDSHPPSGTPSATAVQRALGILEYLDSSRRGLNISEISRKLNIPKSSAHVIVLTLERLGYIHKEAGSLNYSLGLKAYGLGQGMMKTLSLADIALPHMRQLVDELHLPAHLAIADKDQGVFIQKLDAPGMIKFDTYVGRRMDLHCTGVGKVILAFGPQEPLEHMLSKDVYMRHTRNTITKPKELQRELQKVRRLGYGVDDEEEEMDVRCVAVPVLDDIGRFVAALSVTGTTGQISLEGIPKVARRLRDSAAAIFPAKKSAPSSVVDE
jgi:DNA-binding IclR family transcriptional regulator